MADKKISQLGVAGALVGTEILAIVQGGTTVQTTINNINSLVNLTGYVPFTGATSDVDLGAYLLSTKSIRVTGTSGSGDIHLRHQSADATATGQSTSLFADVNGDLKWKNDGNYYTTLKTSLNTADRIYTYPDANGTIALTSNIGTWGALNYPTWVSGTPFVKMTAAGTFALDTNTYQPLDSDLTSWAGVTRASGFDTFTATPSSANLRALLTDENGTGAALFDGATSPTFTTDITTPLIIGGSAAGSTIQYKGTSGNGTSTVAAHEFLVGNNGATSTTKIYNSGQVSIGNYASPTNLRILTIGQDTAYMTFGSIVGATNKCGIYFNTSSPSQYNYNIYGDGNTTYINGNSQSIIQASNTNVIVVDYNKVTFSASPMSSGALTAFNFNSPTNTGQTASTNIPNFKVTGSTKTWAAGTLATQYFNYFSANTVAFASASTATNVYGLYVEAATAGTNATITNNYAAGFSGHVVIENSKGLYFTGNGSAIQFNDVTSSIWWAGALGIRCDSGSYLELATSLSGVSIPDSRPIKFGTTTGTKIGTATNQKLAFWNATPIVQPSAVTTVQGFYNAMSSIGLIASGTITLPTGYTKSVNNISTNTSAGSAANTEYYYICTASLTLTLPTAVGNTNEYNIKVTSGTLTINTTSSETIDGSTSATISVANTALTLISDGSNWQIF